MVMIKIPATLPEGSFADRANILLPGKDGVILMPPQSVILPQEPRVLPAVTISADAPPHAAPILVLSFAAFIAGFIAPVIMATLSGWLTGNSQFTHALILITGRRIS
jgi:hypothetical protein